jgi:hypothetical protein
MRSPWELGCIHRGNKWQTLNISVYRDVATANLSVGGGAYANGDANILDQVKFTSDVASYGKVDVNTTDTNILQGLFARIDIAKDDNGVGPDYRIYKTITASSGNPIDLGATTLYLANAMKACSSAEVFPNRAAIMRSGANGMGSIFYDPKNTGSAFTSKAERDQLIGKIVNLVDYQNVVKVIVLAQSLQDIGSPNSGAGMPFSKDWNGDGDFSDTINASEPTPYTGLKTAGYYDFRKNSVVKPSTSLSLPESMTGVKKGNYDIGADRITGEVKLIATLVRDIMTNKWKIVRVEYPEN